MGRREITSRSLVAAGDAWDRLAHHAAKLTRARLLSTVRRTGNYCWWDCSAWRSARSRSAFRPRQVGRLLWSGLCA